VNSYARKPLQPIAENRLPSIIPIQFQVSVLERYVNIAQPRIFTTIAKMMPGKQLKLGSGNRFAGDWADCRDRLSNVRQAPEVRLYKNGKSPIQHPNFNIVFLRAAKSFPDFGRAPQKYSRRGFSSPPPEFALTCRSTMA